ncbi:hypothetical protein BDY17DRAFT_328174 [Neohortaea acidophila]|uniref:Spermatogenesis-associated protein 20-like TRX domain-containing protein n=1 Tax=Neohortaea acidophila TaxID=245834 RepID=A0A6A6PFC0_9PEZI|nr:uncharacterized protein BDY17DRAFT_328174 [Neohortaea acidophila]KAF2478645.1 hypothetical protein BDY17DRAFT_328174 [Neohortaea acidophila]
MTSSASRVVSLTNRCADSKSPYVRSHASNPTAWQLWSPETLALAKQTNRLLFVSIGYSACHWCHVMAHESFADPRIAQLLNEHFIPVKIDREERPDIDRQYMDFLQATSGGGGWPLNVFVTPELEPVFGGTYWPGPGSERARMGTGFEQILVKLAEVWKEQEGRVRENGKRIIEQLREFAQEGNLREKGQTEATDELDLDLLDESYVYWKGRFDSIYGGFSAAPKFPTPTHMAHLLRLGSYAPEVREVVGEEECVQARAMAVLTLERMWKGGIKDQLGHGFARYSVTKDWSLPHFEKMLYDNAQLLPLYLDAWLATKADSFLEAAHDVAKYMTTEPMLSSLGGINASEDADSYSTPIDKHKTEGAYYVWTMDEFKAILSEQEVEICSKYWDVRPDGNIDPRFDAQGELVGQNTLCVKYEIPDLAKETGLGEDQVKRMIQDGRQKLLAHREKNRPRPALDDKIVTAWNGLAIGGLARAGAALSTPSYISAAEKAVTCIQQHLFDSTTNTLRRVYREGPGETPGFADDYAFLISGLIDLYEATFNDAWLSFADTLQQAQLRQFWDAEKHAFFSTPANQPDILIRAKDGMDNAEPSTNGVSASNLFRLASLLNDDSYATRAKQTVATFEVEIGQHPGLFSGMMGGVVAAKCGVKGITVVGDGPAVQALLRAWKASLTPGYTLSRVGDGEGSAWLRGRNELLKDLDGRREMVQVCEGGVCRLLGVQDVEGLFV